MTRLELFLLYESRAAADAAARGWRYRGVATATVRRSGDSRYPYSVAFRRKVWSAA